MRLTKAIRQEIRENYRVRHLQVPTVITTYEDALDKWFIPLIERSWTQAGFDWDLVQKNTLCFPQTTILHLSLKTDRIPDLRGREVLLDIAHPQYRAFTRGDRANRYDARKENAQRTSTPCPVWLGGYSTDFPTQLLSEEELFDLTKLVVNHRVQMHNVNKALSLLDDILEACTTAKKLIDTFPEIQPYVPGAERKLPTVTASNLKTSLDTLRRLGVPPTTNTETAR